MAPTIFVLAIVCPQARAEDDPDATIVKTPGIVLRRTHEEPVLKPANDGWDEGWFVGSSIVIARGEKVSDKAYYLYYEGGGNQGRQIGLATSTDTIEWKKIGDTPVLPKGPEGSWDSKYVTDPDVLVMEDEWLMYYVGSDGSGENIGMARSRDGIHWVKYEGNPIFTPSREGWDSKNVMQPSVLCGGEEWRMYYGAFGTEQRCVGVAFSDDGINWKRYEKNPVLPLGAKGSWDDNSAFGADVNARFGTTYIYEMYYTGAQSDRRYRIGHAVSHDGISWIKDPGPVLERSEKGSWDWFKTSIPTPIWLNGHPLIFYSGHDGKDYVGIGRAEVVPESR
jgi:predicted GH43/DUF377 family glycosyl hydrolase